MIPRPKFPAPQTKVLMLVDYGIHTLTILKGDDLPIEHTVTVEKGIPGYVAVDPDKVIGHRWTTMSGRKKTGERYFKLPYFPHR